MKIRTRTLFQAAGGGLGLLLIAGIAAPTLSDPIGERLRGSLERSLGRPVEFQGAVRFSLFRGFGLAVDKVIVHEDPSIGVEPIAYVNGGMEVRPGLWSLLRGKFVIASIRLDDASINLTKTGPAAEPGRWNFVSFVNRSVMSTAPAIHIRNGRINLKFGETKSVFYLTETDLDITPPGSRSGGWRISCSAKPARTDRPAQGLGSFTLKGRWYLAPERVDLDLVLDSSGLGEITALVRGQSGNIHGTVSSRLHLGGPIHNIGIEGRINVDDVHRWDLLPPHGQGWPLDVRGRLDLVGQHLELESNSPGNAPLPLWVRFRASDYLAQPHWGVTLNWNRFPVAPILDLARHMGAQLPPGLALSGSMDGAIGYSGQGSFEGELAFRDAALAIPDSPPVRFEQAQIVLDHGHVHLTPALVRPAGDEQAQIEADYSMDDDTLDLAITTEALKVASLRAQVALAAIPWLEQVRDGQWSGQLRYHRGADRAAWTGRLELADVLVPVPGLADPVELASARAQIDGARVVLDRLQARIGKIAFSGEYRYEPGSSRPHRLRARAASLDAAQLEAELMPTLRRSTGLIARALGRTSLPDWLKWRGVEGTVQVDDLLLAGSHLENLRARLVWDSARAELAGIQARLDHAAVSGSLAVNLSGGRPSYRFTGGVRGLNWQSGKVDAEGTISTSGTGSQLLARLTSDGTFTGSGFDIGTLAPWHAASGSYAMSWSDAGPRWRLGDLSLHSEDENYTGRGATGDDGRLVIVLTSGTKEMRMTGTLAKLKVDEAVRP